VLTLFFGWRKCFEKKIEFSLLKYIFDTQFPLMIIIYINLNYFIE